MRTSTALKVKRQMLSDLFSSLFPCGAHSARNGQGQGQTSELRVPGCAACSGMWAFIYGCASCTFCLGLWQMLDADGWCLMMVLYMVLSDILAERRMARRTQVRCKWCFIFAGASLADSGLLQSWFVSVVAVHVIFPFVFYLGKNGGTQARRWRRRGERQHAYEQTKKNMPQKMTATCHTRPKASHHKYKAAGINERQQEHKEPGAKILMNIEARTAGWRSSLSNGAGWISSLSNGAHWRMPNKRRRGPGAETSLQQPQHHSQRKLTLSNVLFQFLLGVRRGRVGEENALWSACPKM